MSRFGEHSPADSPDREHVEEIWSYDGELDLELECRGGEAVDNLEYISKSRIKTFLKCPRKFGFKYLAEVREDENFYMNRGSLVHEAFENFHDNLAAFVAANGEAPDRFTDLMASSDGWFQFLEWIGPFFEWELERLRASRDWADSETEALEVWVPHSVEDELWIDDPPIGELPWMGPYDALLHAASVPAVDENTGWVVVDYKTGSVPDPQYRDTGIHIDLEFYAWMLEESGFDVVAGIGMYPTGDENVVRTMPNPRTRTSIAEVVRTLHDVEVSAQNFSTNPTPLCDYCFYQNQCPTSWTSSDRSS